MPKITQLAIPGGATFTAVLANGPYAQIRAVEDTGVRNTAFDVQWPDDNFATTYLYPAGSAIEKMAHGPNGIITNGPNMFFSGQAAGTYFKIRDHAQGGGFNLRLREDESVDPTGFLP